MLLRGLPLRFVAVLLTFGLAGSATAEEPFVSEFTVAGLACNGCAATATEALRKMPGVTKAAVTFATRRARVETNRDIEQAEFRSALAKFGYEVAFANDTVVPPLMAAERAQLDIKVASHGEAFNISRHESGSNGFQRRE